MMKTSKWLGLLVAAFVAGSFIASPELRAYAANTVGSADIIDGSIQSTDIGTGQVKTSDLGGSSVISTKIKDGEVKAADMATDSIGARQLLGVDKLIYASCDPFFQLTQGEIENKSCTVLGAAAGDEVIATINGSFTCWILTNAIADTNVVHVAVMSTCSGGSTATNPHISFIVFNK